MSVVPLPRAAPVAQAAVERRLLALERKLEQTIREINGLMAELPDAIGELVGKTAARIVERAEVQRLIDAEFIRRQPLRYRFVWSAAEKYMPADVVTDSGCAWVATVETQAGDRPGRSGCWRMLAKSG